AELGEPVANEHVERGERRAWPQVVDRAPVDAEEPVEELVVAWVERPGDDVLRVVAPVAVRADPDLEQGWLMLGDRAVAGGRERADAGARPDERERELEIDIGALRALRV